MNYTIDDAGIHFYTEPEASAEKPITRDEVMRTIHAISARIEALDDCECLRRGLLPCGMCGTPPARRGDSGDAR